MQLRLNNSSVLTLSTTATRFFFGFILLVTLALHGCGRASDRYTKRLVHDAKTGQYIGVLRGECKFYERKLDKEVVTYRVERNDGTTIDMPSENVTVTEQ